MEVRGSVALVTGAAAGTGREISLRLGADGAAVIVADVDPHAGEDTAREIKERGGMARFVRADVTSDDDVRRMVRGAPANAGAVGGAAHLPRVADVAEHDPPGRVEARLGAQIALRKRPKPSLYRG